MKTLNVEHEKNKMQKNSNIVYKKKKLSKLSQNVQQQKFRELKYVFE